MIPENNRFFESSVSTIPIVFEHKDFFILEKPAGLACHGPDAENLAGILSTQGYTPFLAHRLDKSSSGLLIVARNKTAAENFRVMFERHLIEKFYVAVADNSPKKKQGSIKGFMKKGRNGSWLLSKEAQHPDDKMAVTRFFSFASIASPAISVSSSSPQAHWRVFIVKISTGMSHQIRVALKANSSVIVGDTRYGGQNVQRLLLHAYALRFTYANTLYEFLNWPEDELFPRLEMLNNPKALPLEKPWLMEWPRG